MTPKQIAQRVSELMLEKDSATKWAGISIEDVDAGTATLSLVVEPHHTNGHGMCHGGVIFMLADSAFAFSCNSRNQPTVSQHNSINYIAPGKVGDKLTAVAREVNLSGKNGIYDIEVRNQNHDLIATFRGCSRSINGHFFEE